MADIRVVATIPPEVQALANTCQELAKEQSLDRFEIAVKSRLAQGINDDNELRITDEMLASVMRGSDAVEKATKPAVSELYARHKAAVAVVNEWKSRWTSMADGLKALILKYRRMKEDLARRQQEELNRAAEQERQRLAAEARKAMRDGNVPAAQEALQAAQTIVAPVIAEATPVLDNSSTRKVWQVEITNAEAVVKGIAAGVIPLSAIKEFDLGFLKKEATKRGGLNWPGIVAKQTDALSVRR